jgi:hypothetical protein
MSVTLSTYRNILDAALPTFPRELKALVTEYENGFRACARQVEGKIRNLPMQDWPPQLEVDLSDLPQLEAEDLRTLQRHSPYLRRLDVSKCKINQEFFKALSTFTHLEKLSLNDLAPEMGEALTHISELKQLEDLHTVSIDNYPYDEKKLGDVKDIIGMKSVDPYKFSFFSALTQLRKIQSLSLRHDMIPIATFPIVEYCIARIDELRVIDTGNSKRFPILRAARTASIALGLNLVDVSRFLELGDGPAILERVILPSIFYEQVESPNRDAFLPPSNYYEIYLELFQENLRKRSSKWSRVIVEVDTRSVVYHRVTQIDLKREMLVPTVDRTAHPLPSAALQREFNALFISEREIAERQYQKREAEAAARKAARDALNPERAARKALKKAAKKAAPYSGWPLES